MVRRATRLSFRSLTTPLKYYVCVCVCAIIFKNRTKYVVIPILGDELLRSKTEEKSGNTKL